MKRLGKTKKIVSPKCGTRTHGALTDDLPALDPTRGVELPNICIYVCVYVYLLCLFIYLHVVICLCIYRFFICLFVYLFIDVFVDMFYLFIAFSFIYISIFLD